MAVRVKDRIEANVRQSDKVNNTLSIQLNGGTATVYDGSANKSINITASSINAPNKDGTNATGTWPINISGTSTYLKVEDIRDLSSTDYVPGCFGNHIIKGFFRYNNMPTAHWYAGLHVKGWTGSYQTWELVGGAHSSALEDLYYRVGISSWSSWYKILSSNNYTNYTVTKTGSGASGTWGISISGNAATATTATTATTANSVAWGNVTGKPSTFTPSSHTHDYLPLTGGTISGLIYFSANGHSGYIGPNNSSWFHFQTNYKYYFSSSIYVNGSIHPYTNFSGSIGTTDSEWAQSHIRLIYTRHLDGTTDNGMDGNLYINYNRTGNWLYLYSNTLIVGGKQIQREYVGTSWVSGRNSAVLRTTTALSDGSWGCIWSLKTPAGSWDCGMLSASERLYFSYATDANYNANNNTSNTVQFGENGTVWGAVWNDYAEYREANSSIPAGRVAQEHLDGKLRISESRLAPGCEIVSDTFGFAIGETRESQTPIAVAGRVLAYPCEPRESYLPGDPVCSGPNGTVSKMSREEVALYPDRMLGTVSEIPHYERWGTGNVLVDGRIWIRIR